MTQLHSQLEHCAWGSDSLLESDSLSAANASLLTQSLHN